MCLRIWGTVPSLPKYISIIILFLFINNFHCLHFLLTSVNTNLSLPRSSNSISYNPLTGHLYCIRPNSFPPHEHALDFLASSMLHNFLECPSCFLYKTYPQDNKEKRDDNRNKISAAGEQMDMVIYLADPRK